MNKIQAKTSVSGRKNVTTQLVNTPFGQLRVDIAVRGYKSSEGDATFDPPTDNHEPEGAEEQALGSYQNVGQSSASPTAQVS